MQSAPSSEIIPQLTLSVVLFHSPLEQLRALVESVIASLRAANLSGVQMVCWDNSRRRLQRQVPAFANRFRVTRLSGDNLRNG